MGSREARVKGLGGTLLNFLALWEPQVHVDILVHDSWVAVKELKLSYYIGETLLFTIYIYTHYGNLT